MKHSPVNRFMPAIIHRLSPSPPQPVTAWGAEDHRESLAARLADLDLANPADFLFALQTARQWPEWSPPSDEAVFQDLTTVLRYHEIVGNPRGRGRSVRALHGMLDELSVPAMRCGQVVYPLPWVWLEVFAEAFTRGNINAIVWGAAASSIMLGYNSELHPSADAQRAMLPCLLNASPMGLMSPEERRGWRDLPDTITIYRGGCGSSVDSVGAAQELAASVHWSQDWQVAVMFMVQRSHQRVDDPSAGLPSLIKVVVPRSAVFACVGNRGVQDELLVDFSRITPEIVQPLRYEIVPGRRIWVENV